MLLLGRKKQLKRNLCSAYCSLSFYHLWSAPIASCIDLKPSLSKQLTSSSYCNIKDMNISITLTSICRVDYAYNKEMILTPKASRIWSNKCFNSVKVVFRISLCLLNYPGWKKISLYGKGDTFICGMRAGPPYANPVYSWTRVAPALIFL